MRALYIILLISLITGACKQEFDYPFQGKDKIHFKHYNLDHQKNRIYFDSITCSLGLLPEAQRIDTLRVVVELLGNMSDIDRPYQIAINQDSTTAVADKHYKTFNTNRVLKANQLTDTIDIEILRDDLSESFTDPKDYKLFLVMKSNKHFDLGLTKGLVSRLTLNNYLSEPVWWEGNFHGGLDYYHPEKWKVLISFHEDFRNASFCPFDINNDGRSYKDGLTEYLAEIPTYDSETGDRVYMDRLEPIE